MCLIFCVWAPKCCNKDVVLLHNLLICFLNLSFRFMQMFSLQLCKISDGCRHRKQDHKCVHKQNASAMLTWKPELTVPTSSLHSWLISIWFLTYLFKVQLGSSEAFMSFYKASEMELQMSSHLPHLSSSQREKKLLIHTSTLRKMLLVLLTDIALFQPLLL